MVLGSPILRISPDDHKIPEAQKCVVISHQNGDLHHEKLDNMKA
jgi:hypothetical protein